MAKQFKQSSVSCRKALTHLGLGVAVAYTAPTILHLDSSANAVQPSCSGGGKCNTGKQGPGPT